MKSIQNGILLILVVGFSIGFFPLIVEAQYTETRAEESQLVLLRPSFANPVIVEEGVVFEIHVKSVNEIHPIEIQLISFFITYNLSINEWRFKDETMNYSVLTPEGIIPQIYGIILVFPTDTIFQPNSVMVTSQERQDKSTIDFIHITDTQLDGVPERTEQAEILISEINLLRPDLVLVTGDLIEGLATVDGQPMGGNEQYPIIYNTLKELKVPALICNGNHDFYINDYGNGVELWEKYFLPIEYISQLSYKNALFVGASTYDYDGLTPEQSNSIINIFNQNINRVNLFFAHSDYASQFETIYSQGNVIASFLGHEHIGSVHTVGSTLEIITDNSIPFPLHTSAPGHFRMCQINNTTLEYYDEIESLKLSSTLNETQLEENVTLVEGTLNNDHTNYNFSQITEEIVLTGMWETFSSENISNIVPYYNSTHTMLEIQLVNITQGLHSFKVNLSKKEDYTTDIETSAQSSSPSSKTSSQVDTSSEKSSGLQYLTFSASILFVLVKKRKKEDRN